jgi:hypothetical protein
MLTNYGQFATNLAIDVVAVALLAYGLYFRRHRRADLLLAYVVLNIGIFVTVSFLSTARVEVSLGFGLFAILSIIRLRSSAVTQQEVAYYFVTLVLGLVNGLTLPDRPLVIMINALLLVTLLVVDAPALRHRARRTDVTLDTVHTDDDALVADLEHRLGGPVMHHEVNSIDYARNTMVVDVRYRSGDHPAEESLDERRVEVTLDVVHADTDALVADLQRRLGGWVVDHRVTDIDYVRDTMTVQVWHQAGSRRTGAVDGAVVDGRRDGTERTTAVTS